MGNPLSHPLIYLFMKTTTFCFRVAFCFSFCLSFFICFSSSFIYVPFLYRYTYQLMVTKGTILSIDYFYNFWLKIFKIDNRIYYVWIILQSCYDYIHSPIFNIFLNDHFSFSFIILLNFYIYWLLKESFF